MEEIKKLALEVWLKLYPNKTCVTCSDDFMYFLQGFKEAYLINQDA